MAPEVAFTALPAVRTRFWVPLPVPFMSMMHEARSQPVGKKFRAMRFQATFSTASANCGHSKGRRRMSPRFTSADTIEMHYAKIGVTVASYRHRHIQELFNIFRARPYLKLLISYCSEARAPNSLASLHYPRVGLL